MSKGTKNYFRHSFSAHKNAKLSSLVDNFGKAAGWHYWVLVELCAEQYINRGKTLGPFVFSVQTVVSGLVVKRQQLGSHLLAISQSVGGQWLVADNKVHIEYDNIAKYIGSYDSYTPQLKESKVKESKVKEIEYVECETTEPTGSELNEISLPIGHSGQRPAEPKKRKPRTYKVHFDEISSTLVGISEEFFHKAQSVYQKIDIEHEIKKAETWIVNNRVKSSKLKDFETFLMRWFSKSKPQQARALSFEEIEVQKSNREDALENIFKEIIGEEQWP